MRETQKAQLEAELAGVREQMKRNEDKARLLYNRDVNALRAQLGEQTEENTRLQAANQELSNENSDLTINVANVSKVRPCALVTDLQ